MTGILESNRYAIWVGKQSAKGTANTTPSKRLVQVAGDFGMTPDDGTEQYSDLTKYGANTDWVNSRLGDGEPAIEATPTELAYALWLYHGAETVTAVTGPPAGQKHSFVPSTGLGWFFTAFTRVGQSTIRRHQHNDCMFTRFTLEGSTANKAVRFTPRALSLDPSNIYTSDPTAAMPVDKSLLYTDGVGSFTIDGVVFKGQSQFSLAVDDAIDVVYGDDTTPYDFITGDPSVGLTATVYFDGLGLAQWNKMVYGTATPTAGTKPLKVIPALGSYSFLLAQNDNTGAPTGRALGVTVAGVKWTIPPAPAPNPAGGATEIALAGQARPVSGQPMYKIDVTTANADVAFTV